MARPTPVALITLACLAVGVGAWAQASPAPAKDVSPADLYVDFSVPDVAALGLFGVNPNTVTRPGNLKEFSLAVLPLAAGGSNIGGGVALSWAPIYTFAHSVDDYRSSHFARRLAFSLATTKDSKTSEVTVAGGARIVLRDDSDPVADRATSNNYHEGILKMLMASLGQANARAGFRESHPVVNFFQDVAKKMTPAPEKQATLVLAFGDTWDITKPPVDITTATTAVSIAAQLKAFLKVLDEAAKPGSDITPFDITRDTVLYAQMQDLASEYVAAALALKNPPEMIKAKLAKAHQDFLDQNWNAVVATIDVGALSSSSSGTWGDLKGQKTGAAFMLALPAGRSAQFVAQVQARKGLGSAPDETSFYSGGGRFLIGSATERFSVEGLVSKANDVDPQKNGVSKRATIGTEIRVSDGLWIELAVGSEWTPANANSGSKLLSLANLKYAFNSKPRFDQIPGAVPDSQ